MFKAINARSQEDIIILDPQWANRIGYLRGLDHQDVFVCQGCQQPVRVKAGQLRRWHFAHKHLQDCPLQHESPAILASRAILYEWLASKFGEAVTLEKSVEGDLIPRPVDCWVETQSGRLAYWLIESQIKPQDREALMLGFEQLRAQVNWVFLAGMLHEGQKESGHLHLTTTERELMRLSDYDQVGQDFWRNPGYSLHYLDPDTQNLTTFRSLRLVHSPQLYAGRKEVHQLSEMLVMKKTGEFVHPGEYEQLKAWQEAREQAEKERAEIEKKRQEREKEFLRYFDGISGPGAGLFAGDYEPPRTHLTAETVVEYPKEAICELCGQVATAWYSFDNTTKKCKCMDCYRRLENRNKGISQFREIDEGQR